MNIVITLEEIRDPILKYFQDAKHHCNNSELFWGEQKVAGHYFICKREAYIGIWKFLMSFATY